MTDEIDHRRDYAFRAEDPHALTHDEPFYSGALSFMRRKYARDLAGIDVAVIGAPFDISVTGRPGTRFGPRAVRAASANLAWERAYPWPFDVFEVLAVADWGDIVFDHGRPERVPAQIEAAVRSVLAQGCAALIIGGDHFTTYPSLIAHAEKHGAPLSLIQFDAHSDTWDDGGGRIDHGVMFRRAVKDGILAPERSIQVGLRTANDDPMGFEIRDADWVHERGVAATAAEIRRVVGDNPCYMTFDIDCLDPAFAPGTGTPVCGGLTTHQAKSIIRALAGINLIGMDMVEVSPPYDHAEISALAGATLALEMLCVHAVRRMENGGVE